MDILVFVRIKNLGIKTFVFNLTVSKHTQIKFKFCVSNLNLIFAYNEEQKIESRRKGIFWNSFTQVPRRF